MQKTTRISSLEKPEVSNALCRSGVVLLCSHVEGFLDELVNIILERIVSRSMDKEKLPRAFFYFMSRDIILDISRTTEPEKIAEKIYVLLDRDQDIWSNQKNFQNALSAERFLSNFSTPQFDKINSLVKRFGYNTFKQDVFVSLKTQAIIVTNMLEQVIQQRNKIAHGDHVTTSTYRDLDEMIKITRKFCRTTDELVGAWFAKNGCSIR